VSDLEQKQPENVLKQIFYKIYNVRKYKKKNTCEKFSPFRGTHCSSTRSTAPIRLLRRSAS
jgi:hypothetical protein